MCNVVSVKPQILDFITTLDVRFFFFFLFQIQVFCWEFVLNYFCVLIESPFFLFVFCFLITAADSTDDGH